MRKPEDQAVVDSALRILRAELVEHSHVLDSPIVVRQYLQLLCGGAEREFFVVLYLNVYSQLIADEVLFMGTLNQATIYPREIMRGVLRHNAASIILCHNHPSGNSQPSQADIKLTRMIKDMLAYVDVAVLDHLIVTRGPVFSFAENFVI